MLLGELLDQPSDLLGLLERDEVGAAIDVDEAGARDLGRVGLRDGLEALYREIKRPSATN